MEISDQIFCLCSLHQVIGKLNSFQHSDGLTWQALPEDYLIENFFPNVHWQIHPYATTSRTSMLNERHNSFVFDIKANVVFNTDSILNITKQSIFSFSSFIRKFWLIKLLDINSSCGIHSYTPPFFILAIYFWFIVTFGRPGGNLFIMI